ncbi:MAG: dTDP-4-dehydrorhamnose reductase [Chloroflexi bacterium]|nr:dTDP-4-dehydrorhamnose reductase [Chloroflexota bacterium]
MRIAITGSTGQLGRALQEALVGDHLLLLKRPEHDITLLDPLLSAVRDFQPEVIIHTAAMTDVDGCEKDPSLAYRVNVLGTRNVALAAQACGAALVYISTDYVFRGDRTEPYWEYDQPDPQSVYARTKWWGEQVVRDLTTRFYIVRVAWLYGDGPRNFVKTVLRLAAERPVLRMVTDEVGSPTYAQDVAQALARLVRVPAYGIYHLPNAGVCSRYEWAAEILRLAGRSNVPLEPMENYPRPARVPKRVHLQNVFGSELGLVMRPWQEALADYMERVLHG